MNASRFKAIEQYHAADEARYVKAGMQMRPVQHKHRQEFINLVNRLDLFGTAQGQRLKTCLTSDLGGASLNKSET